MDLGSFFAPDNIDLNEPDDDDPPGLICELKTYETRYNGRGEKLLLAVGSQQELRIPRTVDHDSAMVLTRNYDKERQVQSTTLCIQSPHLKKALRTVVKKYPSVTLDAPEVIITDLPKCFFHYLSELRQYANEVDDMDATRHVYFALRYMEQVLHDQLLDWNRGVLLKPDATNERNRLPSSKHMPGLNFDNLWMAFRPGCLIYVLQDGKENVYRLQNMTQQSFANLLIQKHQPWILHLLTIDYDGKSFGYSGHAVAIYPYEGHVSFTKLRAFPLEYHEKRDEIMQRMVARGRAFIALRGVHHREYDGVAKGLSPFRQQTLDGEEDYFPLQSTLIRGRIMVDAHTFGLRNPGNHCMLENLETEKLSELGEDEPKLDKYDLAICCDHVLGFSLSSKQWCHFQVDLIRNVKFNVSAFETLILPKVQKDTIHSLVRVHADAKLEFDDMIKGKGKGMIFLLHGVPGTGKTLTAESIADYTQKPLYTISSGELGTNSKNLEEKLSSVLDLAATWNAIVLIDEADIFLEQRNVSDLERNGLVSIFLRLLEYYEGILFLTTNRVGVFDKAFKSRVHLAIKYHRLSPSAQSQLWEYFIRSIYSEEKVKWLDEEYLKHLGTFNLNGREIKNAFRTSHALAIHSGKDFSQEHMDAALEGVQSFAADLEDEPQDAIVLNERPNKRRRQT